VHFKKIVVEMVKVLKWRIFWKWRIRVYIKVSRKTNNQTDMSYSPSIHLYTLYSIYLY